jgi:adenylate cyclase
MLSGGCENVKKKSRYFNLEVFVKPALFIRTKEGDIEVSCGEVETVGRDATNTVVLNDSKVSRSHALIRVLGEGKYYLIDLGSSNGTIVDGKQLLLPRELKHMDEIRIGDTTIVFVHEPEVSSEDSAEPDVSTRPNPNATLRADSLTAKDVMSVGVTVLVVDIRDYTAMSGLIPFSTLGKVLSHWVAAMTEVAEKNDGVIDKFIGDSVMFRWATEPESEEDNTVVVALKAALDAHVATARVNSAFPDLPLKLGVHCGLNCGLAVFGTVGGRRGGEYTVLGDSVNLAFRLEKLTKAMNVDVAVGPDAFRQLPHACWKDNVREISIPGKEGLLEVCGLTFGTLSSWFSDSDNASVLKGKAPR